MSGLVIDWKCIASTIYNQINEKNTIYLNFMNNINQKLSNIRFCNRSQKFRTFYWKKLKMCKNSWNLSSFESDHRSSERTFNLDGRKKIIFSIFFTAYEHLSTILKIKMK